MTSEAAEFEGPVIRDKRRIDPDTGQVREPRATATPGPAGDGAEAAQVGGGPDGGAAAAEVDPAVSSAEVQLAERTADLQRLQAEYLNYKRRVERDRNVTRDAAKVSVLSGLLPVLDDIGRAREHDELTGGFKAVAESLERTVASLGLTPFGEAGEEFDPHIHEALMHTYSDTVSSPVCQAVLQVGYRFGERVVRPARVAVAEPSSAPAEAGPSGQPAVSAEPAGVEPDPAAAADAQPSYEQSAEPPQHSDSENAAS